MPEEIETPVQQTPVPGQQVDMSKYVPLERYTPLIQTVERLTLENRSATEKFAQLTSEIERLKGEQVVKETERTIALGERDKQINTSVTRVTQLETENADLRALKLKMEVAKDLKRPDLISIADRIPNMTDKEALTAVMADIAGFADSAVKAREAQLLAGVTPQISSVATQKAVPASEKDWVDHVNSFPLGSPDRNKAYDSYYEWLTKQK